jgi:hypothetical protein
MQTTKAYNTEAKKDDEKELNFTWSEKNYGKYFTASGQR